LPDWLLTRITAVVGAADVGGIDRQIRARPRWLVVLGPARPSEPFLIASWCEPENAVKTSSPRIGMARVDRQLVAVLDRRGSICVDVGEVEPGIDALRVEVERERHEVDVAGALAVAEQAALDAVRARPAGRSSAAATPRAAVVVRVQRNDQRSRGLVQVAADPLDLVGVDVGRRRLDRGGQVERSSCACGVGLKTSITASQTSVAKSSSVPVKLSGRVLEVRLGARASCARIVAH
jgi:hypothetical protein